MPTFDTPEPITATIDLAIGDVRISAGDRGTTVVDVQPSDASNEEDRQGRRATRVEYANGQLLVKAPKLRLLAEQARRLDRRDDRAARRLARHGALGLGDFHCDGELGDCRIKTGLGRIRLDQRRHAQPEKRRRRHQRGARDGPRRGHGRLGRRAPARARRQRGDQELQRRHWVGTAGGDLRLNAANGSIAVDLGAGQRRRQVRQRRRPRSARSCAARSCSRPSSATSRSASARAPPPGST